jgi:hypothetical protein
MLIIVTGPSIAVTALFLAAAVTALFLAAVPGCGCLSLPTWVAAPHGIRGRRPGRGPAVSDRLETIDRLDQLVGVAFDGEETYLRYSRGPEADAHQASRDYESGLELPGLSAVPLTPPAWWHRPAIDWLARQVCKYAELGEADDRCAWVLTGRVAGRGPDHEPLIIEAEPLALLSEDLLDEARRHYHEHFEVGRDSRV